MLELADKEAQPATLRPLIQTKKAANDKLMKAAVGS
jgi:hypothetical protein